ncbi:MAG: hypothetical protein WCP55_10125 [Lentisphaerota bacterium]
MFHTRLNDAVLAYHMLPTPHWSAGIHITGDNNTTSNGTLETREFDLVIAVCHRVVGMNITHALNNYDNGQRVHRLGDIGNLMGPGLFTSIAGSSNVTSV